MQKELIGGMILSTYPVASGSIITSFRELIKNIAIMMDNNNIVSGDVEILDTLLEVFSELILNYNIKLYPNLKED